MSNLLRIIKDRRKLWIKPRESPKNLTPGIEPEEEEVIFGISKKLETTKEAKAKETEEAEKLQEEIEKVSSKLITIRVKDKGTVIKMTPSGCNSDGVLEFYAQKPDDMKLHAGHGYLSGCSMSLEEKTSFGNFKALKITVTIDEDPRLKAWSLYSAFGVVGYGIIKHCPRKIFCGHGTAQPYKIKGEGWNDESDTFGKQNQTWEPYTLEFKPKGTNEIGMIRGNDDFWKLNPVFRHNVDTPKGYYDFDDQIKEVKMFGEDTQGFEHSVGVSILDKINKERWDNSITPLTADSSMMMIAEGHAYYMSGWDRESHSFLTEEKECVKENINYFSFADEVESKLAGVEFSEYNRVVFCKRNILASSMDSINYESLFEEAMTEWLAGGTAPDHILRNSYNSAGFGVATLLIKSLATQVHQHYYNVYICVDLGNLSNIGTRQTSQEALETIEGPPVEQTESRSSYIEKVYDDNYSFEIDTKAKFALDSHNPICRTYTFYDFHPIPYAVYYLYGHYNDLSVLNANQTHLTDYEDWPFEKQARWRMDNLGTQPDMDPRNYPALMLEQRYNTSYLETGLITKGPYQYHYGDFWKYEVNGKDVNGLSKTKYSIGDWVVIQKGSSGYGHLQTTEWYLLPSSPYYHVNVHEDKEGVS